MYGIDINTQVIKAGWRIIKNLVDVQGRARKRLIEDLLKVCNKCDTAYSSLQTRLKQIRASYQDPDKLAMELLGLEADATARKNFKPEELCADIDVLLTDLSSNTHPLKYSVNIRSIAGIRNGLYSLGNWDHALYKQYDDFIAEVASTAQAIRATKAKGKKAQLATHASELVEDVRDSLKVALREIRKTKDEIVAKA